MTLPVWEWSIDGWIVLAGMLSECACSLLGAFLVLQKISLMGDAISHAVLPGIAVAFILTGTRSPVWLFIGAAVVGLVTALLSETVRRYGKVEHGAAMGVVFSVLFAAGLVLIRRAADHVDIDPSCVLFGSLELIPLDALGGGVPPAIRNLAIVMVLNLLFVILFFKELKLCSFDAVLANTLGLKPVTMHYVLMSLVAVTTVACFEAVGSILVIAMLIVPAASAYLLTDRLGVMLLLGVMFAALSAILGHYLATHATVWLYNWGVSGLKGVESVQSAAMIAVVAGIFFAVTFVFSPHEGLLVRLYRRCALAFRIVCEDVLGMLFRWQELQPSGNAPLARKAVIAGVGSGLWTRCALRLLEFRRKVERVADDGSVAFRLTQEGHDDAAHLVRSHRLWEAYLARHFHLPLDHLHMPAERMEHYITPDMSTDIESQIGREERDPHGRKFPETRRGRRR